jgi:hypothetical protein
MAFDFGNALLKGKRSNIKTMIPVAIKAFFMLPI